MFPSFYLFVSLSLFFSLFLTLSPLSFSPPFSLLLSLPHLSHPQGLLSDDQVSDAPILILGNKIDAPKALGEDDIRQFFNLNGLTTGKVCSSILLYLFFQISFLFLLFSEVHFVYCHLNFMLFSSYHCLLTLSLLSILG